MKTKKSFARILSVLMALIIIAGTAVNVMAANISGDFYEAKKQTLNIAVFSDPHIIPLEIIGDPTSPDFKAAFATDRIIPADDQNGTPYNNIGSYDVNVPHIIINQIYGGQKLGGDLDNTVPVSHSFCELYNPTDEDIDLTGWTLHYGNNGEYNDDGQQRGDWAKLELSGIITAHTSFLVRMMPTTSTSAYLRLNLYDDAQTGKGGISLPGIGSADQDWLNQYVINKGSVFVLIAGNIDLNKNENPFDNLTSEPVVEFYVDMLGVGGNDSYNGNIFAYEGNYTGSQSKQKSIRRVDFIDTDHNATEDDVMPAYDLADTLIIGYNVISTEQMAWARPRTQADGVWAVYLSGVNSQAPMPPPEVTTVLDAAKPNALTNIVGSDSKTTRLITWQMPAGTTAGKVRYSASDDLTSSSENNATVTLNADSTVKLVVNLTELDAGTTYYYSVAGAGTIYDDKIYSFTTDNGGDFSFVHVSDTQGVDESQYRDYWGPAVSKIIEQYPDVSFLLETGDLIDTRNDADQWRWFFKYAQEIFGNYAFIPVVGNHEQTANYDADIFRQHFTVPNALVHNDVTPGTVYSFDYGNSHFVILNSECKTEEGKDAIKTWLRSDLTKNKQKWTIAALHRGPFGMGGGKVDIYDTYGDILIDFGADLILHGHDHIYMRCYGNSDDDDPDSPGIYSLETGGSGFKQDSTPGSGKYVDVTAIVNNPSYSIITVSDEKISVESVYVDFNAKKDKNIYPIKTSNGDSVDFEITKTVSEFMPETLTLTPASDTSKINLTWYSDRMDTDNAKVKFGSETVNASTVDATTGKSYHKATVTGLIPDTAYTYKVSNDGKNWSEAYTYKTPETDIFTFAVVGDPQLTTGNQDSTSNLFSNPNTTAQGWKDTINAITTKIPKVNFIAGVGDQVDLTANGSEAEYTNFFAPGALRNLPFAPAIGNHDRHYPFIYHYNLPNEQTFEPLMSAEYGNAGNVQYAEIEAKGNYYYTYNNALFVVLNDSAYPTSTLAAKSIIARFESTIKSAVATNPDYTWLFVQHHKSTASVADHCADRDIQYYVEAGFEKLMDKYGVDFVLAGHDHVYARSYPMKNSQRGDEQNGSSITNPNGTIYLTMTTASGLKYYGIFNDTNNLYVKDNPDYPYLFDGTAGSVEYMKSKLPLSTAVCKQDKKPEFTSVTVAGGTVVFATYNIDNLNNPIDEFTVTKTNAVVGKTINILHTNDSHGRIYQVDGNNAGMIGIDKIAAIKNNTENAILVDAGDTIHGLPIVNINSGLNAIDLMSAAGYDVMTPGNHDFNYGSAKLLELAGIAKNKGMEIISANVFNKSGTNFLPDTKIVEIDGVKVGFFGITALETPILTSPTGVAGIEFRAYKDSAETAIAKLKNNGAQVIVALAHVSREEIVTLIKLLDVKPDVVIEGHDHLLGSTTVEGVLIAGSGQYQENLGKVSITLDSDNRITEKTASIITKTDTSNIESNANVKILADEMKEEVIGLYSEVVAKSEILLSSARGDATTLGVRTSEQALGNLVADAMRLIGGADIAVTNGGGLRADIRVGDITKGDINAVLPFGNVLVIKEATPKILKEIMENGLSKFPNPDGRFPQISGMNVVYDPSKPEGQRIVSITIDGVSLNLNDNTTKYKFATNDFMASGGDGYDVIATLPTIAELVSLDDMLIEYITVNLNGTITAFDAKIENRISEAKLTVVRVTPTAVVEKLNGNKNNLTITITELYSDGTKNIITKIFSINNNAAGKYAVGEYTVYVDTKGNTQIREIYIVK